MGKKIEGAAGEESEPRSTVYREASRPSKNRHLPNLMNQSI